MLLKQDPIRDVLLEVFQNFQNSYFCMDGYVWIYIVSSLSCRTWIIGKRSSQSWISIFLLEGVIAMVVWWDRCSQSILKKNEFYGGLVGQGVASQFSKKWIYFFKFSWCTTFIDLLVSVYFLREFNISQHCRKRSKQNFGSICISFETSEISFKIVNHRVK